MSEPRALVLWDGDCRLCGRAIAWIRRQDRAGRIEASTYQQAPAPPMTPELARACARAVHVVTPSGVVLRAGRASLYILRELGYRRLARVLALPPFVWAIELGYVIVARNRTLFGRLLFRHTPMDAAASGAACELRRD